MPSGISSMYMDDHQIWCEKSIDAVCLSYKSLRFALETSNPHAYVIYNTYDISVWCHFLRTKCQGILFRLSHSNHVTINVTVHSLFITNDDYQDRITLLVMMSSQRVYELMAQILYKNRRSAQVKSIQ